MEKRKRRKQPEGALMTKRVNVCFTQDELDKFKAANTEGYTLSAFANILIMQQLNQHGKV